MEIPILAVDQLWSCPNCTQEDRTTETYPHTRFHACPGLKGLTAPMVPVGMDCKVEAMEREDYVGRELVQTDADGRPIMAVRTERADGSNDLAVLAPCATSALFS